MPRFYFDLQMNSEIVRDSDGTDVADAAEALIGCIEALEEGGFEGVRRLVVRNEDGEEIASFNVDELGGSRPGGVRA